MRGVTVRDSRMRFVQGMTLVLVMLLSIRIAQGDQPFIGDAELIIVAIDRVEVPARRSGTVDSLFVREGEFVTAKQSLGQLDLLQAKLMVELAEHELRRSTFDRDNESSIQLASATKNSTKHELRRLQFLSEVAMAESDNPAGVQSAQLALAVAKNELDRAKRAHDEYPDSVSGSELEALRLAHAQTRLQLRQAELDQTIANLRSQAEQANLEQSRSNIVGASAELDAARKAQRTHQLNVLSRQKQLSLAELALSKHQFVTPIPGIVTQCHVPPGSWVREGEPVATVIRLDKLRGEGFVSLKQMAQLTIHQPVRLKIKYPEHDIQCVGEVSFVYPVVDAVSQDVRIWIDFPNPHNQVHPGMRATIMEILDKESTNSSPPNQP